MCSEATKVFDWKFQFSPSNPFHRALNNFYTVIKRTMRKTGRVTLQ